MFPHIFKIAEKEFCLKNWFNKLYAKTVEVAKLYTGTFIVVMILNQLLFFGFCLNPICLVAAMPHVLLITVVVGTFINKINNDEKSKTTDARTSALKPKTPPTSIPGVIAKNEPPIRGLGHTGYDINNPKPPAQTPLLCPICQSEMILRTARHGRYAGQQFHGCSRYPQCKGIINI